MQTGTDVETGSSSLGEEVASLLGDFRSTEAETPGSSSGSDAGESPAAATDAAADTDETTVPDGAESAERAGDTPAAADATTAAATPTADDDPFKDATPATYTVDGQTRTFDKIQVLGEDGAVIRAADLPDVLKRLGERDHLFETNQRQHRDHQHLEQLATWKTTGPDGKEVTYTGQHGIVEAHAAHARADAALSVLDALLSDPALFRRLVAVNEKNEIVPDPTALEYLQKDVLLAANTADQKVRSEFARQIVEAAKPAPAAPDFTTEAPRLIGQIAQAANLNASVLTDRDKAVLAEQLQFHVRDGQVSVAWQNLVRERIELRQESAKAVQATSQAAKDNATRLAQAARGKPAAKAPGKPVPAKKEPDERTISQDSAWDAFESASARALRHST